MSEVIAEPGSSSPSTTEQVKERVQDAAEQARGKTREQLNQQVDTRSTQAGQQVSAAADAMRRTGGQLREEGKEGPAKLMEQVAERGERLGSYLTESDGDRILRDVESFARRQPWLVAGGSVVLGFFASRFLKASSSRRYRETPDYDGRYRTGYVSPAALPAPPAPAGTVGGGVGDDLR
jgi:ElaB/YqjD/DUF883 family membrane-anchored ribosome-binding protein